MLYDVVWCVVFCGTEWYRVLFCGFVWCLVCMVLYHVVEYYEWYIIQHGVVEEFYLTHYLLFAELNELIISPY